MRLSDLSTLDVVRFAVAVLIATSGVVSLALFLARIRKRDNSLLYFGLGAVMYGTRLVLEANHQYGGTVNVLITLLLPVPLVLFMAETVAPGWKSVALWVVIIDLVAAVLGLWTRLAHLDPKLVYTVNSTVVLLSIPVFLAMAFFPPHPPDRDLRILRAGLVIFLLFVVYTNLAGLRIISGNLRLEFIGFSILLGCLGYVTLARTQRNEERLAVLHRELEIARGIQSQLLPDTTSTANGLTIASRYVPASSVAGDFYDFLATNGALGILIADVSGHGIPAALSASMVKVAVRSQTERAADPAEVLRGMNSILCGNLQGQFVSAGYLFLNPGQGKLIYAGAGHPPLLVWRSRSRQVECLEENGLLLGILPGSSYTAKTAPLGHGDRCLLYTDGLLEATCPSGEEFGSQRLQDFLAENASLAAQPFCDALAREINEWSGKLQQPQDDMTIVTIDFPGRPC
jgi:sigma-B regulation protein RsbU (phosphoserine phosphatase)